MMADYLYKVGVGLARFGKVARAREVLSEGLRHSEANGLNAWYFPDRADLAEPPRATWRLPLASPAYPSTGLGQLPAVQEVALGLREYALSGQRVVGRPAP